VKPKSLILLFLALVSCASGPGLEESPASVVLVVADLEGGGTRYGAGVVLDDRGSVITNWHVLKNVRSLRAMLYQRGRPSYTPMDGGLARFLAENQASFVDADVVRADADLDVALIHLHTDTTHVPKLSMAEDPPRVGERVFALGHPNESVWSLTSGVVSSVREGLIQHDAALGTGSSGGPLLDARGRVVGINTSKLFEPAEGIGFARPAAVVRRFSAGER
jgi:S1-C subfamily serine protease